MSGITPNYRSIRQLFQGRSFSIDEYQREYKWQRGNIEELITDLLTAFSNDYREGHTAADTASYGEYFLGSIIVTKRDTKSFLVDGQQRLTSLTLLLIHLYRVAAALGLGGVPTLQPLIHSDVRGQVKFNLDIQERIPVLRALFEGEDFDATARDESEAWRREAFNYDASSDLLPAVIAFCARTVETTLGRGVLRSYQAREEALTALRGRMDVAGQFKRAGVLTPIASKYDDFTEDIIENRVLRAAIRLALRVPRVDPTERQLLMRQLVSLETVEDVPVRASTVDTIQFTRLNQHYAPALGLARLVLANLALTDARGSVSASSFMINMNDLFQRFVTERLRRALRSRLDVIDEPTVHLGLGRQVSMEPDLVFREPGGAERLVGDVKCKLAAGGRGRSSDYYQLLAYTTAMDLPQGMLIYCRGQDDVDRMTVTVKNAGTRLTLRSVDLTGSPEQVEHEIAVLAEAITSV